jgi:hypothetical protein
MSNLEYIKVCLDWVDGEFDAYYDPSYRWNGFISPYLTRGSVGALARQLEDPSFDLAPMFWFTTDRDGHEALVIVRKDDEPEDVPVIDGLYDFNGWSFYPADLWED